MMSSSPGVLDIFAELTGSQILALQSILAVLTPQNLQLLSQLLQEGGMPSAQEITDALLARLNTTPISVNLTTCQRADLLLGVSQTTVPANVKYVNNTPVIGTGQPGNEWGPG